MSTNDLQSLWDKMNLWFHRPVFRAAVTQFLSFTLLILAGYAIAAPENPDELGPHEQPFLLSIPATEVTPLAAGLPKPLSITKEPSELFDTPLTMSDSVAAAQSYTFQLINSDWSVRTDHTFLRSEPSVYVGFLVEKRPKQVKVTFEWYKPDGKLVAKSPIEKWLLPDARYHLNSYLSVKDAATSIVLGQWFVKVVVETETGEIELEQILYFNIETDPETDPPTQYHYKKATLSKGFDSKAFEPIEETEVFSTVTDEVINVVLQFDYYYLDVSGVGLQFQMYYDETQLVYDPVWGLVEEPIIPDAVTQKEVWSLEIDYIWRGYRIGYPYLSWMQANNLLGKWHIDIGIDMGDGEGWRDWITLPFTVEGDTEPPTVEILEPKPNNEDDSAYETEQATLMLSGTATDNVGVDRVTWQNYHGGNGPATASGTEQWSQADIKLHDGDNLFFVKAYDEANNGAEDTIMVRFDNSPPELKILEGEPAAIVGETYVLHLYATDKNHNLREVTVDWGDGSAIETKGTDDADVSEPEASVRLEHVYNQGGIFTWLAAASDEEDEAALALKPVAVLDEEDRGLAEKILDCEALAYDPIDLSTGGQVLAHNLLTVQGVLPIALELSYHSRRLKKGPTGRAWEDNRYGTYLTEAESGEVTVHWTTNTYNVFPKNANGEYEAVKIKCRFDRLVKKPDGGFTLTRQNGRVYQFNAQGRLEQLGNSQGQFLLLSYDGAGRLATVTEPISGVFLAYTYNADNLLASVRDALGRQASVEYDQHQNLVKLTDGAGQTWTYTYNDNGQILTGTNAEGVLLFSNTFNPDDMRIIAQSDGIDGHEPARFAYTENPRTGKVGATVVTNRLGQTSRYRFNDNFQAVKITDELGNSSIYPYDANGKLTRKTDGNGNTTAYEYSDDGNLNRITDAAGNKTVLDFDNHHNLLSVTNAVGAQIRLSYDQNNNLLSVTDPLSGVTRYTYNAHGQVRTKTSPSGGVSRYEYQNGFLVGVTSPANGVQTLGYDAAGRLSHFSDADNQTFELSYDGLNRLTQVKNPLGHSVSLSYDSRNNLVTFADANGNVTRRSYSPSGNLVSQINALGAETRYEYDPQDRLYRVIDALGGVSQLGYDASNRLVSVTNPLGEIQKLTYDAADNVLEQFDAFDNLVSSVDYDSRNNPVRVTNALSKSTAFEYDALNRLKKTTDPLSRVTSYSYDALNRLVSSVDALTGESRQGFDADSNRNRLVDPNNNETRFEFDNSGRLVQERLATGDKVKYTYSARDLLAEMTNGRGQQREFEYDAAGRITRWTDTDGMVSLTYDPNGNVLTVTDKNGTITREYDALNRVTQYTNTQRNTLQYTYNQLENLTALIYPDGRQVFYGYNAASRLTSVTDWAGRVTRYEYDKNGRLINTLRPNGTKQSRVYNQAGQLEGQKDIVLATSEVISQFDFSYDAAGNIVQESVSESDIEVNLEMSYTAANRLATYNGEAVQFDADGNMVLGPLSGDMANFDFDSRNRLVQAGETVYRYDAENQRIGVNQTQYVINSQPALSQVLVKTKADGTQTYYVYGLGLIGQEQNAEYLTYHFDFRGSTVALTDETGIVTERFEYSPYGVLVSGEAETTQFLFNGMYGVMSDDNGLYHMRARYYHPEIRRFVNQDILLGSVSEGQTLNRYAFVTGRPVSLVDPFGLNGEEADSWLNLTINIAITALDIFDTASDVVYVCSVVISLGGTLVASPAQLSKKVAIKNFIALLKKYIKKKPGVALDTNALVAALEYGDLARVDAALKGRIPLVSRQAVREFLERGNLDALRQFLSERGGKVGLSATESELKALLDLVAQLPAKPSPRKIGKGDANVLGCALKEGVPLITNDRKFCNLVNDLGFEGEKF